MELPADIETKHGDSQSQVLKLLKNLFGQKQAGWLWNEFLTNKLISLGFEQSKVLSRVSNFCCVCWWWDILRKISVPTLQCCEETSRCWFGHRRSRVSSGLCWCQHSKACNVPHMYCKVFEVNASALELAFLPKLCPHTKYINVCHHHFYEHVCHWKITISPSIAMIRLLICSTKPCCKISLSSTILICAGNEFCSKTILRGNVK